MTDAKDLIYLYCITDKRPQLKTPHPIPLPSGERGRVRGHFQLKDNMPEVYFVNHQGLYAVASKVSESEFSKENLEKNLRDIAWLKMKVSMHEKIIEEVMKENCVLPFKFATIFNTWDSLKASMDEHGEELRENLRCMKGKEEWGVKIYCDMDRLSNLLINGDEEILSLDNDISSSSPGRAFLFKKKRKELIYKTIEKMTGIYIQDSLNGLIKESLQMRINRLLPREVTEREDEMILNAAFLLKKGKVNSFIKAVDMISRRYEENGLIVHCTGPWPPYNFCGFRG